MARLAVLASGAGTNFVALHDAVRYTAHEVAVLVCNVPAAPVLEKAAARGVPAFVVDYRSRTRSAAESEIEEILRRHSADILALAGFMKILSPRFVDRFAGTIVNIHPSLLPRHPGVNAIERSFAVGDAALGVTVHIVDHGVDTGPILAQESFDRDDVGSLADAEERIHALEHELYPKVVLGLLDAVGGR